MPLYLGKKKISSTATKVHTDTDDANITPINLQRNMVAYAKGKKVVGTAKCFEFAHYGLAKIEEMEGADGSTWYGFKLQAGEGINLINISPTPKGDIFTQTQIIFDLEENTPTKIGVNLTNDSDIYIFHGDGYAYIYSKTISDTNTQFYYFIGKDNDL